MCEDEAGGDKRNERRMKMKYEDGGGVGVGEMSMSMMRKEDGTGINVTASRISKCPVANGWAQGTRTRTTQEP